MKPTWIGCMLLAIGCASGIHGQHAVEVIDYVPGQGNSGAYANPASALGPPTRLSDSTFDPGVVSPFQPAWQPEHLVTIGAGGRLVLAFEEPVVDDPANPFGIDLLVFGNAFFTTSNLEVPCTQALYEEGGMIEVSLDGTTWFAIENVGADGLYPTLGYLDADAFDEGPGAVESDFTKPVDPGIADLVMAGACWDDLLAYYDGSGGGTPIDLAPTGLPAIRFIRISVEENPMFLPEIDAVADVTPAGSPADFDGNGLVDGSDLSRLLGAWGESTSELDLDGDGVVTGGDLSILLGEWS
jgi:hypothetical protein